MKLYQVVVRGHLAFLSGTHAIHSRRVFRTKEEAEAYIPEFSKICLTPRTEGDLFLLESIEKTKVNEIELE
jgi:hypothetical protein